MVRKLVFARVAAWKFKPDQRRRFEILKKSVPEIVRKSRGFRESLILLSREDPNLGMIVTLWNSDESENAFDNSVFKLATQSLEPFVTGPPEVTHFTVFSYELK